MASCSSSSSVSISASSVSVAAPSVSSPSPYPLHKLFESHGLKETYRDEIVAKIIQTKNPVPTTETSKKSKKSKTTPAYLKVNIGGKELAVLIEAPFHRRGGYKTVFPAVDLSAENPLDMPVFALATMPLEVTKEVLLGFGEEYARNRSQHFQNTFDCEVSTLNAFQSTHTVTLIAASILQEIPEEKTGGILMEWCPHSLKQRMRSHEPLTYEEKIVYTKSLIDILVMLKEKRIYFRDLKPGNLLIDSEGKLKLADFGLAVREEDGYSRFAGTRIYYSPEYAYNQKLLLKARKKRDKLKSGDQKIKADQKVKQIEINGATCQGDVWAAGLILFELFYGHHPFVKHPGKDVFGGGAGTVDDMYVARLFSAKGHRVTEKQRDTSLKRELKSSLVAAIIRGMLRVDAKNRLTAEELKLAVTQL